VHGRAATATFAEAFNSYRQTGEGTAPGERPVS
jgi:hypothetical protein